MTSGGSQIPVRGRVFSGVWQAVKGILFRGNTPTVYTSPALIELSSPIVQTLSLDSKVIQTISLKSEIP